MLDKQEFNNWCRQQDLSQAAQAIIEEIRSANPSRRVTGARKNVCGSYPSRKMGVTIQFESHHNELARIYELEHDPCVLEYYDQPPAIELVYQSKNGRKNRHQYTPDFFIIRTDSAVWEECKTELERQIVGVAEVTSQPYADPKFNDAKLVVVDVRALQKVSLPVTLAQIKQDGKFTDFDLLRLPRLSVVPVSDFYWQILSDLTSSTI